MAGGIGGDRDPEEVKKNAKLGDDKKYCETKYCCHVIYSGEQYCNHCKLNRYPEKYAKSCRVCACGRKTLDEYCDQHKQKCLSCDSREVVDIKNLGGEYYCVQHAGTCATCSTRTPRGQIYCEIHQKEENLKRLIWEKFSLYDHKEVVRFNTGGNNNLATLINGSSSYTLGVLVYEPAIRNKAEILQKFEISNGYDRYNLESAKNKASSVRNELDGDNPILAIHPQVNSYVSFSSLITNPYVIKNELPYEYRVRSRGKFDGYVGDYVETIEGISYPNEPAKYLKPLDIVKINMRETSFISFYHFGVYLGNNKVCHYSKEKNGTEIVSGSEFLSRGENGTVDDIYGIVQNRPVGLFRYHPIIPFKNYQKIAEQIAWAEDNNFRRNEYNLANRNCEHFANMCVYGINYSEQIYNSVLSGNNCKGSTIKLVSEMNESNNKLGEKSNWRTNEIKEKYLQEVPPKQNCCVM